MTLAYGMSQWLLMTKPKEKMKIVPSGQFTSAPNIDMDYNDKEEEKETKRHYDSQWPMTEMPIMTIERRMWKGLCISEAYNSGTTKK